MQTSFADINDSFPRIVVSTPGIRTCDGSLFVRRLIYGAGHRDLCTDNPTWEQIASAVSNLEGHHDVLLEGQAPYPYLVVGGSDGEYLVVVVHESSANYLCDPSLQEGLPISIALGGQSSDYEADLCVGTEIALQAIWAFVEQGVLLPSVRWVDDYLLRDL